MVRGEIDAGSVKAEFSEAFCMTSLGPGGWAGVKARLGIFVGAEFYRAKHSGCACCDWLVPLGQNQRAKLFCHMIAAVKEPKTADARAAKIERYTGEGVYIYAFYVADEIARRPIWELLGQPVAQFVFDL